MDKNGAPFTYYVGGTSLLFARAFAAGCGGRVCDNPNMLASGSVAMFGHPDLFRLLRQAQTEGRTWYYADKAYFKRGEYYRITRNDYMHDALGTAKPDRFLQLGVNAAQWKNGSDILLCPQSNEFFKLHGLTQSSWVENTTKQIRKYTDRKIRVHYKDTGAKAEKIFKGQLNDVWAVVVYTSMAGVQAVMHGVPCFATAKCTSSSFGLMDLSKIETPHKPDNREQMAWVLADNQWTLEEIRKGAAWEKVR
jgi:hypothetical protein